jgi:hypothetical protein
MAVSSIECSLKTSVEEYSALALGGWLEELEGARMSSIQRTSLKRGPQSLHTPDYLGRSSPRDIPGNSLILCVHSGL